MTASRVRVRQRQLRSWRWLLPLAALPLLAYLIIGLLGGRAEVVVLTGTQPQSSLETILGFFYILSFFGLTMASPVCVLAAGIIALRDGWAGKRDSG